MLAPGGECSRVPGGHAHPGQVDREAPQTVPTVGSRECEAGALARWPPTSGSRDIGQDMETAASLGLGIFPVGARVCADGCSWPVRWQLSGRAED